MELIELSLVQWLAVGGAALLVGLTKAGFGAGAGILAVPLMAVALGGSEAMLPVMLPVLICGDIFSIIHYPNERNVRNLKILIPGMVIGVGLGWGLLLWLKQRVAEGGTEHASLSGYLDPIVGGVCLIFVGVQLWRYFREWRLTERAEPYKPENWQGWVVGGVAGATSTLAHAAGSLIALFLLPQKLDKRIYVGTAVTYFFFGNLIKFVPYGFLGMFTLKTLLTSLALFPVVVLGTLIGVALNRRLSGRVFVLFIYFCTLLMGIKLLIG
ncbi:MAG: sulfite exporter TauE/SafE family protein [Candidatus Brocadiia bacterium]